MLVKITLFAALLLSIVVPFAYFLSGTKNKARYKLTIGTNAAAFFGIMLVACGFMFSGNAQAAEAAAETLTLFALWLLSGCGYSRSRSCNWSFMYRWWYRRSKCSKRSIRCN